MRALVIWVSLALLTVGATAVTLAAFNSSVYSASAFVARYFDAVKSDNITELLRTPGVAVEPAEVAALGFPASTSQALLRSGLISAAPADVTIQSDEPADAGNRIVTVTFSLAGVQHTARYVIEPAEPALGVMQRWRFASSPLQLLTVHVEHGTHFTIGGLTLDARASTIGDPNAFTQVAHYLAVAPTQYTLHYSSELVAAAPVTTEVLPEHENTATVDVQATQTLVDRVQEQLDAFLAECVQQQVLQPAGCPFGATITDRVTSPPTWTIVSDPQVTLVAGSDAFQMPYSPGMVHLSVGVQSLYDGAKSTHEENVGYEVALTVQLRDDGAIAIQLQ